MKNTLDTFFKEREIVYWPLGSDVFVEKDVNTDGVVNMSLQGTHLSIQDSNSSQGPMLDDGLTPRKRREPKRILSCSQPGTDGKTSRLGENEMEVWVFHQGFLPKGICCSVR